MNNLKNKLNDELKLVLIFVIFGIIGYCLGYYVIGPILWNINH